jgi:excisionase family DNA binding protein
MTKLYTLDEAAEAYDLPRSMLSEAVISGALKAIKRGANFIRIREETLDKFLEAQESH